jgi:hypothetical protein
MNSDFNTGGFSYRLSQKKTIGKFSFSSNFSKNIYRLLYL